MTIEQQKSLERELTDAMESGDSARVDRAHANIMLALIDCQRKTADRVKTIAIEWDRIKERAKGAKTLWKVLGYLASAGGGATILKLLTSN